MAEPFFASTPLIEFWVMILCVFGLKYFILVKLAYMGDLHFLLVCGMTGELHSISMY